MLGWVFVLQKANSKSKTPPYRLTKSTSILGMVLSRAKGEPPLTSCPQYKVVLSNSANKSFITPEPLCPKPQVVIKCL